MVYMYLFTVHVHVCCVHNNYGIYNTQYRVSIVMNNFNYAHHIIIKTELRGAVSIIIIIVPGCYREVTC